MWSLLCIIKYFCFQSDKVQHSIPPANGLVVRHNSSDDEFYQKESESRLTYKGIHEENTTDLVDKNWSAIKTYKKRGRFTCVYNVTIRNNNIVSSLKKFDMKRILNDQIHKFKINVAIGSILINQESEILRYFHAFPNQLLYQTKVSLNHS